MISQKERPRILVIRGGAIGDFILTLPAIGLLRETFPDAILDILGYPHIAALAEKRFYADNLRSIEYGPLAGFFAKNGSLNRELSDYFAGYQQVISYLYDPDRIFEDNLRKVGVRNFLAAFRKPAAHHAAEEWARPLEALALFLQDPAARLYPTPQDHAAARAWLGEGECTRLALHPGSGSVTKNWAPEGWLEIGRRFWEACPEGELVIVGGEADADVLRRLELAWAGKRARFAVNLALPTLAALIRECRRFAGHDSGVGHIAAAVGVPCTLLFGPTDPAVWAPRNFGVEVLRAPAGDWSKLEVAEVWNALERLFTT